MIQYFPIVTGSLTVLGNINVSGSITTSGSITISGSITSASFADSASNATNAISASYANNLTVAGTLTAQTIVVQTVTSSVIYSSGSNVFGNDIANTQVLTGSVTVTGSLAVVTNGTEFQVTSTGVKMGNVIGDAHSITGSVGISGSATFTNRINGVVGGTLYNTAGLWLQGSSATDGIAIGGTSGGDKTIDTYGGTLKINATSGNGLVVTGSATFSSTITATGIIKSLAYVNVYDGSNDIYLRSNADFGLGALPAIQVASNSPLQFATNNSIKMIITSTGNVGINEGAPSAKLDILGPSNTPNTFGTLVFRNSSQTGIAFGASSTSYAWIQGNVFGSGTQMISINPQGSNVSIGTTTDFGYKLNLNGQPGANGYTAWTNWSDSRLKENITDFDATNVLNKICTIRPVTYNYNELSGFDEATRARRISGFIAQELMEVFPDMVGTITKQDTEYYDTNLSNLNLYLVKAIQELNTKFEEYKATHP